MERKRHQIRNYRQEWKLQKDIGRSHTVGRCSLVFPQYKAQHFQSQWGVKGSEENEEITTQDILKHPACFSFQTVPLSFTGLKWGHTVCSEALSVQFKSHQNRFHLPLLCTSVRLCSNFLDTCGNTKLYKKKSFNTSNKLGLTPPPTSSFKSVASKKHLFQPRSPAASYKTL